MVVLSLFDGMGCGYLALKKLGIKIDKYIASEIKDFAVNHTGSKIPNIIHVGDVTRIKYEDGILYKDCHPETFKSVDENGNEISGVELLGGIPVYEGPIDLLIGGSPCQNLSTVAALSGTRLGLEGLKSKLFYEYVRIKEEVKPKHFLLENVEMSRDNHKIFDKLMGTSGIHINSSLVSYQKRPRIYWTDLDIEELEDKNISFQDYMLRTLPELENALYVSRYPEYLFTSDKGKQMFTPADKEEMAKHLSVTGTGFELNLTDDEVKRICGISQNQWLRKQLDANRIVEGFEPYTDREFVDELHESLKESLVKKTKSRDNMCGLTGNGMACGDITGADKIGCLTRKQDRFPNSGLIKIGRYKRFLNRYELCQAQNIPYNYLNGLTYSQIQDVCGDGWTIDVIKHILKGLLNQNPAPKPKRNIDKPEATETKSECQESVKKAFGIISDNSQQSSSDEMNDNEVLTSGTDRDLQEPALVK